MRSQWIISISFIFAILCAASVNGYASEHICDAELNICTVSHNDRLLAAAPAQKTQISEINPEADLANKIGGDLTDEGEKKYVTQITTWLASLPEKQRKPAYDILSESHLELQSLRKAIYNKKSELAAVCFDDKSSLELLPKLGMDLQKLRQSLRDKLEAINQRLLKEAGVKMDSLAGEGLWLQPLPKTRPATSRKIQLSAKALPVTMLDSLPAELRLQN